MIQKQILWEYYRNQFSLDPLLSVITTNDFDRREFAVMQVKKLFIRNLSFQSATDLLKFLRERPYLHVYVGAVYDRPPSQENPINRINWVKRELVFDIDLTDFDLVRKNECGCQLDKACHQCWEGHIKPSIFFIEDTLREDFGFKNIKWLYSGRRGVHAWILDDGTDVLTSDQRAAIASYLSLIKSENIASIKELPRRLWERVLTWVVKQYLLSVSSEDLISLGFSLEHVQIILDTFRGGNISEQRIGRLLTLSRLGEKKIMEEILFRRLPRIDHKVTIDISRVLRMPGSIHGATGKPTLILDISRIDDFDPFSIPSIFSSID